MQPHISYPDLPHLQKAKIWNGKLSKQKSKTKKYSKLEQKQIYLNNLPNLFKYIYFCFLLLFTSSSPCRKDQFAVPYFPTSLIIVLIWDWIRQHSLVCCCGLADILYILECTDSTQKSQKYLYTRSEQLPCTRVTAFSPTSLFLTSVNLKKTGMASRNIVIKNNTRCFKSALL